MYDQVLILPDGGVDFMRTVRLATLYAERVHIFAPTMESTIDEVSSLLQELKGAELTVDQFLEQGSLKQLSAGGPLMPIDKSPQSMAKFREHLQNRVSDHDLNGFIRTSVANRSELELLQRENVVISLIEEMGANLLNNNDIKLMEGFEQIVTALKSGIFPSNQQIPDLYRYPISRQPTVCLLVEALSELIISMAEEKGAIPEKYLDQLVANSAVLKPFSIGVFFLVSSYYAIGKP
jgi:hypothetical protein